MINRNTEEPFELTRRTAAAEDTVVMSKAVLARLLAGEEDASQGERETMPAFEAAQVDA